MRQWETIWWLRTIMAPKFWGAWSIECVTLNQFPVSLNPLGNHVRVHLRHVGRKIASWFSLIHLMYLAFALLQLNMVRWEQIMRKSQFGHSPAPNSKSIIISASFTGSLSLLKYWRMVHFEAFTNIFKLYGQFKQFLSITVALNLRCGSITPSYLQLYSFN